MHIRIKIRKYVGPCFHGRARPQVADGEYALQKWRVAANMLNKQPWTADRGGPPAWGLVEGLTTPHRKKETVTNLLNKPRKWTDSLLRPQQLLYYRLYCMVMKLGLSR